MTLYHILPERRGWVNRIIKLCISIEFPDSFWPSASVSCDPGRFFRLHPVSTQNWSMLVFAGWPELTCLYAGVHKRISLILSLLSQQRPVCLGHLSWMVCERVVVWPCSCCLLGCCFQDLFEIACGFLV